MNFLSLKLVVLAIFVTAIATAQVEQGSITGVVIDESGAAVAGAKVTVTNLSTRVRSVLDTNSQGNYSVPFLAHGEYSVSAEKPGFALERITGINLRVGLTATINLTLRTGALQQEVTVTASTVLLEQQSSSLGNVVSAQQIVQLPLNGRNPYALLLLAPGVTPSGGAGTGPIVSGGRSNTSGVLFDGQETRNTSTNDIAYTPPLETVAEFKVITNNFSAEYGRSGGGRPQWH